MRQIRYEVRGCRTSNLVTSEQMRELDRRATELCGIPSLLLMENAGRAVARVATEMLDGTVYGKGILVCCGPGNNGGDGLVAARHLYNAGAAVMIAYYGDREKAKGDALTNLLIAEKMHLNIVYNPEDLEDPELHHESGLLPSSFRVDLVVDALLGIGVKGEVREPLEHAIEEMDDYAINRVPVLSVDIPSGIDADTGAILGGPLNAWATVTFSHLKIGHVTYPGADCTGDIIVAEIGIPARLYSGVTDVRLPEPHRVYDAVRPWNRHGDAHKGTFGHVAIIAGSVGMTGAATLAAMGALRIGTGLVTVAVPESLNDIMEVKLTEAMTIPVPEGKARAFGMASLEKVLEIIEKRDAAVIGPGFGRDEDTVEFTLKLIRKLKKPAIIDADALYAISRDLSVLKKCKAQLVITPHPGEMAMLLGTSVADVQSNRLEVARSFAKEHGVTVVLKGAGTVIAGPDGTAYINTTGTPGMATGGTGDVLSGMIGGLLAQEKVPGDAANAGVYLHGLAGEIAAGKFGEAAMIASDLVDCIGDAIQEIEQDIEKQD